MDLNSIGYNFFTKNIFINEIMNRESELRCVNIMKILNEVKKQQHIIPLKRATIGFDGYIDELLYVVKNRKNSSRYEPFKSIREFGNFIVKKGINCGLEMISMEKKIGGNGPILANALSSMGVYVNCIGTFGEPELQNSFLESKISNLISIGNAAYALVFEFHDGKLMFGKIESLNKVTWDYLIRKVGLNKFINYLNKSDVIGITNWSQIINSNNIWEGILKNCMPDLDKSKKRYIFFDLADPSQREKDEFLRALKIIEEYGNFGTNILGLNLKEVEIVYLSLFGKNDFEKDIIFMGKRIFDKLNIKMLVIHSSQFATVFFNGKVITKNCLRIRNPKLLTGCGDNFNAGFCLGLLIGIPINLCLELGIYVATYYITNGKSPDFNELLDFISTKGEKK